MLLDNPSCDTINHSSASLTLQRSIDICPDRVRVRVCDKIVNVKRLSSAMIDCCVGRMVADIYSFAYLFKKSEKEVSFDEFCSLRWHACIVLCHHRGMRWIMDLRKRSLEQ
jgi:hypothetical protein